VKSLKQILIILRMEFLFAFRRGGPVVATAAIWLLVIAGDFYILFSNFGPVDYKDYARAYQSYCQEFGNLPSDGTECKIRTPREELSNFSKTNLTFAWFPFFLLSFLLLPMVSALSIPSDHQFGVSELLYSIPVTGSVYLAGKTLGLVLAVTLVSIIILIIYNLIILAGYGLLSLSMAVNLIMVYGLPIVFLATALGTLIGAFLRTRKSATILGLLAGLIGIGIWMIMFPSPTIGGQTFDRLSYSIFQRNGLIRGDGFVVNDGEIVTIYFLYLVFVSVIGVLARQWLKWKENI
jgi:hypothetical protein